MSTYGWLMLLKCLSALIVLSIAVRGAQARERGDMEGYAWAAYLLLAIAAFNVVIK